MLLEEDLIDESSERVYKNLAQDFKDYFVNQQFLDIYGEKWKPRIHPSIPDKDKNDVPVDLIKEHASYLRIKQSQKIFYNLNFERFDDDGKDNVIHPLLSKIVSSNGKKALEAIFNFLSLREKGNEDPKLPYKLKVKKYC